MPNSLTVKPFFPSLVNPILSRQKASPIVANAFSTDIKYRVFYGTVYWTPKNFECYIKAIYYKAQPVKIDLNKKSLPKQKTIQNFTIDAQGFRKTKNENPPTWEMGVTS